MKLSFRGSLSSTEAKLNLSRVVSMLAPALKKLKVTVARHQIRNASNETIKYLEKRPYLMEKTNDTYLPKEALITKKTVTISTKENRFLKFMLLKIIGKIDKFILKLKKLNNNDAKILERLLSFKREIDKVKLFRWSFILQLNLVELIQERAAVNS